MCLKETQSNGETCPIASFKDVTKNKFSTAPYYWQQWTHSGRPYVHYGAPVFVDLNRDGVMDYFVSMHQDQYELGLSTKTDEGGINPVTERIILTDTTDDSGTFVDSVVSSRRYPSCSFYSLPTMKISLEIKDHHCDNVIDLDGDGKYTVFLVDSRCIVLSRAILKIKATWTF